MTDTLIEDIKQIALNIGLKILLVLVVLFVGFKVVNFIEKRMMKNRSWIKIDPTLQSFLRSFLKMGLKMLVIVTAIYTAGIEMTTFVAVIGAAGIAVGLALQGSLSNLAGGVLIIALRPFRVGDYVEGVGQAGTVTEIGLFYTHLTTPDNRAIIIPNANIANSSLVNYGVFQTRRVDIDIMVSNQSNVKAVKTVLLNVIEKNQMIMKEPEPFVRLAGHSVNALNFKLRVWVKSDDYWEVYFTLMEDVKEAFDMSGIEIPSPQVIIKSNNETV